MRDCDRPLHVDKDDFQQLLLRTNDKHVGITWIGRSDEIAAFHVVARIENFRLVAEALNDGCLYFWGPSGVSTTRERGAGMCPSCVSFE